MARHNDTKRVRLGLLGSGTVGEALQDFVFDDRRRDAGAALEIVKIYTRRPAGKKWYATRRKLFTTRAEEVIDHPEVDIVVEALGFQKERELAAFKNYIIRAFQNGKAVVTSDKAVLAKFGREIWDAAERWGQQLRFEACVGGGIPIIRSLTESFAREEPQAIYGIVNGTCNYILSEMSRSGKSYEDALREAQVRGYAETNPEADTGGADAEAKLILLAAVTFGLHVAPGRTLRKGIEEIQALDFLYAARKGSCTIKQLAVARREGGALQLFVSPALVPQDHFLAAVDGPTNAIFFKGERSGGGAADRRDWNYVFAGPGAGGGPTAIALLGDVCELARGGNRQPSPVSRNAASAQVGLQPEDEIETSFYIRFVIKDRAGIIGDIGRAFGRAGINISEIWQLEHSRDELKAIIRSCRLRARPEAVLPFVITLDRATVGRVKNALRIICRKNYILAAPVWLPIWNRN